MGRKRRSSFPFERRRRPRPRPAHPPGHLTTRRFAGCARSDGGSVHGCKSVGRDTVGAGIEFAASCQGGDFLTDSLGGQEIAALATGSELDRNSTRLNSSHANISNAVFCLKKKNITYWTRSVIRNKM